MINAELLQRDPFDAPTPGQSLTDEPNKWQWEKPAEILDINESFDAFVDAVEDPVANETISKLLYVGVSIESIVSSLTLKLFGEGIVNPDVAELLKPPAYNVILKVANDNGITPKVFNGFPKESVSDKEFLSLIKKLKPKEYTELLKQANDKDEKIIKDIQKNKGFMVK
tara:strand:+ start:2656 stop:3162 length:507 start_codon:yes stop_codon:yes gene_type:complete